MQESQQVEWEQSWFRMEFPFPVLDDAPKTSVETSVKTPVQTLVKALVEILRCLAANPSKTLAEVLK